MAHMMLLEIYHNYVANVECFFIDEKFAKIFGSSGYS